MSARLSSDAGAASIPEAIKGTKGVGEQSVGDQSKGGTGAASLEGVAMRAPGRSCDERHLLVGGAEALDESSRVPQSEEGEQTQQDVGENLKSSGVVRPQSSAAEVMLPPLVAVSPTYQSLLDHHKSHCTTRLTAACKDRTSSDTALGGCLH